MDGSISQCHHERRLLFEPAIHLRSGPRDEQECCDGSGYGEEPSPLGMVFCEAVLEFACLGAQGLAQCSLHDPFAAGGAIEHPFILGHKVPYRRGRRCPIANDRLGFKPRLG
jgi:hypothetical protein